ncbi:hypothetical protein [Flexithrix dorotheae]|uniref:hypothetical protein n=1 Tax=Flexithrix dorotheae TaxID=70993 RepID=UPI000373AEBF|nr:hypothetical protein [Flexithrix dorotheae]
MPLKETTKRKATDFLHVIEIGSKIMAKSEVIDAKTKEAFKNSDEWYVSNIKELIKDQNLNSAGLKSLVDPYFTYWNESVGVDIEEFWYKLEKNSLNFIRKDSLKFALEKGRFRNVHQGMSARKDWSRLKKNQLLSRRLSIAEINQIDEIINLDEKKRAELLKKTLLKRNIPQSQYLKFGDCMAYFEYCKLFDKYLNEEELKELYNIWNSFQ